MCDGYRTTTAMALDLYEAARTRLPAPVRTGACERLPHLGALAARFDVFLLDAYGVLNIGASAIPGAAARVVALRAAGKRVLVVSNAAGTTHQALLKRYTELGYDFAPNEVITSRQTLLQALAHRPPRRWGLVADARLAHDDLAGFQTCLLADEDVVYDAVDGFIYLGASAWNAERQARLGQSLCRRPRPVLVGNPDLVAPLETGLGREPGYFAHQLAERTGIAPEFFGKPFAPIFASALARLAPPPERQRTLMVGDTLHTDILGGQVAGLATALVIGHGFFGGSDPAPAIARTGIQPDFILDTP